jgi:hypothetical protein
MRLTAGNSPPTPHPTWGASFADGATLYDVTHLGCRSARYTPATGNNSCSPENVRTTGFPVNPGEAMPAVNGCRKQDYAVLIVIGLPATH